MRHIIHFHPLRRLELSVSTSPFSYIPSWREHGPFFAFTSPPGKLWDVRWATTDSSHVTSKSLFTNSQTLEVARSELLAVSSILRTDKQKFRVITQRNRAVPMKLPLRTRTLDSTRLT